MRASRVATPDRVEIAPRRMDFQFPAQLPRHWVGGDPFSTHLMNALTLVFPPGEQLFIDSVRHYRDRIEDPELARAVRGFIGQEAHHRKEHDSFNAHLRASGVPVDAISAQVEARLNLTRRRLRPRVQLAFTCALEHFTAFLAEALMTNPAVLKDLHDDARPLWIWHAIEETEHKAVAFDVYEHTGGKYLPRVLTMMFVTAMFIFQLSRIHFHLMRKDGQLWNLRSWARGMWKYWGPRGYFTRCIPAYLAYYRPSFHPWQHDNSSSLAQWKRLLADGYRPAARGERLETAALTAELA